MHPVLSAQLANAVAEERRRQAEAYRRAARSQRRRGGTRAPVQPGSSRSLTSLRRLLSVRPG
jgi:hypothetical protein